MIEYEVVWDGAHRGQNEDLLIGLWPYTPAAPASSLPEIPWREETRHRDAAVIAAEVAAVFACIRRQPCSRFQLRKATGFSEQSVAVALNKLKKEGRIEQALYGTWRAKA